MLSGVVPLGVTTETSTVPTTNPPGPGERLPVSGGDTAVMRMSDTTVTWVAGVEPK